MSETIKIELNPREFFHKNIAESMAKQKIKASGEVELYLVELMCSFVKPEKMSEINVLETPLAMLHKAAVESPPEGRIKIFKNLGDVSLYISGYFQDYFNTKTFSMDYYITLGANAYGNVSTLVRDRGGHISRLYWDLSENFDVFVEVVAGVREQIDPQMPTDLLATYERWIQNQSPRLRKRLESSGILPVAGKLPRQ